MYFLKINRGTKDTSDAWLGSGFAKLTAATTTAPFMVAVLSVLLLVAAHPAQAQTETVLYSFTCQPGCNALTGVIVDKEGNLYGTTQQIGSGIVFKLTPSGTLTTFYHFCSVSAACPDGQYPYAGLALDSKGNLYGTTENGGAEGVGTVFKLTPSGTETVLYSFTCQTDGCFPQAGVVLDSKGNLYGATPFGGASASGNLFKLTPSGKFTTLYSFCSAPNCSDGSYPYAGVVLDKSDNLYGTTYEGGAYGFGTVFKVTPSGTETVLHSFDANGEDGFYPQAGAILDSKDNVYGTTNLGGKTGVGAVYEVTASGTETILHSFNAGADGFFPYAGLVFDKNGNLYGTTQYGGSSDLGTVFELTPKGVETVLHSFVHNGTDGSLPLYGSLSIDKSGNLYGTTSTGGGGAVCGTGTGCGVVFKIVP